MADVQQLLDVIRQGESLGNYNATYGNVNAANDLSQYTVKQIIANSTAKRGDPAIGAYQFKPATLRSLVKAGVVSSNTYFTPEVQDQLAVALLKRRGLDDYLNGSLSQEVFAQNLSKEWASLATSSGASYYPSNNTATVSYNTLLGALPGNTGGQLPTTNPAQDAISNFLGINSFSKQGSSLAYAPLPAPAPLVPPGNYPTMASGYGSLTPAQLAQAVAGNGPLQMPRNVSFNDIYGGILPSSSGNSSGLQLLPHETNTFANPVQYNGSTLYPTRTDSVGVGNLYSGIYGTPASNPYSSNLYSSSTAGNNDSSQTNMWSAPSVNSSSYSPSYTATAKPNLSISLPQSTIAPTQVKTITVTNPAYTDWVAQYGTFQKTPAPTYPSSSSASWAPPSGSSWTNSGNPLFASSMTDQSFGLTNPKITAADYSTKTAYGIRATPPPKPPMTITKTITTGGISTGGNGGGGTFSAPQQLVQIASGKTVPVGTISQSGGYTYQVQADGSIKNTTTGRISASSSGPVGVAAVANSPSSIWNNQSSGFASAVSNSPTSMFWHP